MNVKGTKSSSVLCILNGAAGARSAGASAEAIVRMFSDRNIEPCVRVASGGAELADLAKRAVLEGHDIVVAGGGDGTINCVGAALVGTPTILGVLPLGSLNHFAKDLKIPLRLEEAVDVIANGGVRTVDVGEVNGRIFLNNSSLGLYPRIVRQRDKLQSAGNSKWFAFARAIGYVMRRYAHLHVRLDADGAAHAIRSTPFVFIGNNKYQTDGWNIGARARLDDGRLWVYMAPHEGPFGLAVTAVRALFAPLNGEAVDAFETTACWIETQRRRIDVAFDGEVADMETPLRYRSRPGALRVMAPTTDDTPDSLN
jgi:diacylglycerol kinase family enzyme